MKAMLLLSCMAALAICCRGVVSEILEEEFSVRVYPEENFTSATSFQSAGLCDFYSSSICTSFGIVERDNNGVFLRNASGLFFAPDFGPDVFLSQPDWQYHKPLHIDSSDWLVKTIREGGESERFHVFDAANLQWKSSNLDQMPGYDDWTSIHHQRFYPFPFVTDTGLALKVETNDYRFAVISQPPVGFNTEQFDQPPLRLVDYEITIGILNGALRYTEKTFTQARDVPFTEGISSFKSVKLLRETPPSVFVLSASFQNSATEFITRFISFRLVYDNSQGKTIARFGSFEDREGIVYPEYRVDYMHLRVVPGSPTNMYRERVEVSVRNVNLDVKLDVVVAQSQELQLRDVDMDSRALRHAKCEDGECLAAFIGTSGKINVFYTNEGNFDYKWARRAHSILYARGRELSGVQVSRESEGSWIVMVMVKGLRSLYFARVKPMESAGMVWFDVPFDVRFDFSACGLYVGRPDQPSYLACTKRGTISIVSGTLWEMLFRETTLEVVSQKDLSIDVSWLEEVEVERVECVAPGMCVVVLEETHALLFHFAQEVGDGTIQVLNSWYSRFFAFEAKRRKFLIRGSYYELVALNLIDDEYGGGYIRTESKAVDILAGGYLDECKVSAVSERFSVFFCKLEDNEGYESFLLDSETMKFRGMAFELRDFDNCENLSTERGVLIEFCVDSITRIVKSRAIKAAWDKLSVLQVVQEEPIVDEPTIIEEDDPTLTLKIVVIVLSSVLGVAFLGGIGLILRKKPIETAHVDEEQQGQTANIVVARPVLEVIGD